MTTSSRHVQLGIRLLSTSAPSFGDHFKLVVVGGGTGGTAISSKFARKLGKGNVAVIEPHDSHYYQAMWTLVGGGFKKVEASRRHQRDVLHKNVTWLQSAVTEFHPKENQVVTADGKKITYDFLVTALGLQLRYDMVKGLPAAFSTPGVCSNYHLEYVTKTRPALDAFQGGTALFTFPSTPIKCAGAPQKIMYIADDLFRRTNRRDKTKIIYNAGGPVIFSAKYYADVLWELTKKRDIEVNLLHDLIEVKPESKEAVFKIISKDGPEKTKVFKYDFLHIGPPCSSPKVLRDAGDDLTDAAGYVSLDDKTLQHKVYPNIFGIGDCTSLPTSKTAAAVAGQVGILSKNLNAVMQGGQPTASYMGYTSCPLVTSDRTCILAEFGYGGTPMETFPVDQRKERRSMFMIKRHIMAHIYWNLLTKGYWHGPGIFRKLMRLGMG